MPRATATGIFGPFNYLPQDLIDGGLNDGPGILKLLGSYPQTWVNTQTFNAASGIPVTITGNNTSSSAEAPALFIRPPAGIVQAINVLCTGTGTPTGGYVQTFNHLKVFSDDINAGSSGTVSNFIADYYCGGSAMTGSRQAIGGYCYLATPGNSAASYRAYVGLTGVGTALTGDGGSATDGTNSAGAFFGAGVVAVAVSGATNLLDVCGIEANSAMNAGSSAAGKVIIRAAGRSDDVVQGTLIDALVEITNQIGAVKFNDGILFSVSTAVGHEFPIHATGTMIRSNPGTVKFGFDVSAVTFSTGGAPICVPLLTPASSAAAGKPGSIEWDASFIYICTATNTWKRATLNAF